MVLEINLYHFVRQSEHDSVSSPHPLLNVDYILDLSYFWEIVLLLDRSICSLRLLTTFEIAAEVLQEGNFLLEFLWIFSQGILLSNILPITASPLHVIEVIPVGI